MKRIVCFVTILFLLIGSQVSFAENIIVFTAHQNFDSRIYLIRMDGSIITYHEYSFYYFADLEVVNNEVYAAEAFAPRAYKVDLATGNLELVIDDWSLFYFYDIAWDGNYLYVTEWDLNRYDINGNKDGTASFSEDVMGGAWDGSYYWTLNDTNEIRCWDLSGWPTVTEVPSNAFSPPSPECRGLWFDGQYFWTADAIDGSLGYIYRFDYTGSVIDQWLEPSFIGWSACVVDFVSVEEEVDSREKNIDLSVFPEPCRGRSEVSYTIPRSGRVLVAVYNVLGQRVATLVDREEEFGRRGCAWNGSDDDGNPVQSGIYLLRFEFEDTVILRKVTLLQ
jgi:hypothetical protein